MDSQRSSSPSSSGCASAEALDIRIPHPQHTGTCPVNVYALQPHSLSSLLLDRPHSLEELTAIARIDEYGRNGRVKQDLRLAEVYRAEGKNDLEAGDLEWAFVNFSRTSTLILHKIPTNSDYYDLSDTQRSTLADNGNLCRERMEAMTATLNGRYETWRRLNPNLGLELDMERILGAMAIRDEEQLVILTKEHRERRSTGNQQAVKQDGGAQAQAASSPVVSETDTEHHHLDDGALSLPSPGFSQFTPPRHNNTPPASPRPQETRDLRWVFWRPPEPFYPPTLPNASTTFDYHTVFHSSSSLCLNGHIACLDKYPVASGGYADVWKGFLGIDQTVAIKVMRPFGSQGGHIHPEKLYKRLWREFLSWSSLSHGNIIRFIGFSHDFSAGEEFIPSLISPWMSNGTVLSYIEKYPNPSNKSKLLIGIAEGLEYLHDRKPVIVHGDVRAGNVLVSDSGVPQLCDFGLSQVVSEEISGMVTSTDAAGSMRWMAPERFFGASVSVASDVWAYGMTILEILTGNHPYHELKYEAQALNHITSGQLPQRPEDVLPVLDDKIWAICQDCWRAKEVDRPSMRIVGDNIADAHDRRKFNNDPAPHN